MIVSVHCVHAAHAEGKGGVGYPQLAAVSSYLCAKNLTQVLWKGNQLFLTDKPSSLTHASEVIGQLCVAILSIFLWDPDI